MASATHDKMERLHGKLADVLLDELEVGDDDLGVSPAMLTVAARFLKDNDITAQPAAGSKISELEEKLKQKKGRRLASVTPIAPEAAEG